MEDNYEVRKWQEYECAGKVLKRASDSGEKLVCFCTADACFRCKQIEPKVCHFPEDYPDITFVKINLDHIEDCDSIPDEITSLPAFLLYKDKANVCNLVGLPQKRPARALAQAIKRYF